MIAAPVLLVWIGWAHGWLWLALSGCLRFLSMFRNPLIYLGRRAMGVAGATTHGEDRT